ncbi:hypothetical protein V5O48_004422 [Marasmius crinis-equi]|uniref:NmrA-like domain-containing protein n=1 Tax=Marasmius crinis-equi TaxID=585013 RepID=A0ABR3FQC0_9AGAR
MSSSFKSFAILGGSGLLGSQIVNAFVAKGVAPLVLSRKSSDKTFPDTVKVAKVDLEDVDQVAQALKEHTVEVVVSAISTENVSSQRTAAEAAKKAGVRLFVPSEFGSVTEGISQEPDAQESSPLVQKDKFIDYLKSLGLPYVRIFIGQFLAFLPWFTGHLENGKVNIIGKGEAPVSFTDIADVGGFVAHILTTLPPSELENRIFRIEGESATLVEVAKKLNKEINYTDHVPGGPANEIKNYLLKLFETGRGCARYDAVSGSVKEGGSVIDNHLWSGHQWKTLADAIEGAN